MKKTFILLTTILFGSMHAFAQCSQIPNNFEIKLTQNVAGILQVQMRHHADAVQDAQSFLPSANINLDGLVFAIAWPKTSNIEFVNTYSDVKPFNIILDNTMDIDQSLNKTSNADNFQTFVQDNLMPEAFTFTWENDKWYTIAKINYSGKLNADDFFSLMNCDYGLAHPNSFYGNTHTDPWLSLFNLKNSDHFQYSPKMITELPSKIPSICSFNIYPNPTIEEFTIDINSNVASQVVVSLSNQNGQLVKSQIEQVEKGTTTCKMNVKEIASGNYMVKITDGKTLNYIQKVQKN